MHFVYKTIVKQFVDSEGRVIPVDLKIDNKIIVIGKSGILNFFFLFFLRLLNNTLLHGVVTILTIVYSACSCTVFPQIITDPKPHYNANGRNLKIKTITDVITESDSGQRKKEEEKKAVETGREKVSHLYVSGGDGYRR